MVNSNQFVATKLNFDKHFTLLESRDITYLLNGDIEGYESGNQNYFVQNQKSNELCLQLEFGFDFVGPGIPVGNGEHLFFTTNGINSQIILADIHNCNSEVWASGECLAFDMSFPIRGVYKYNSQENSRTAYFVDGKNPNRYINFDKPYPRVKTTNDCDTCEQEYSDELDCSQLKINKDITIPCLGLEANNQGQLSSGVYQLGFAWSQNGMILSDFYFSDAIKVWSEKPNIGLSLSIDCVDSYSAFNEYTLVLVTTTKEGSLILYRIGDYQFPTDQVTITNLDNATVIDLTVATQKRVNYDKSKHITTNGETLLIGNSQITNAIPYQIQAIDIETGWVEIKVPRENAHLYPTPMRDEVYELAIEWFKTTGESLGRFHIPGRDYTDVWESYSFFAALDNKKEYELIPGEYNIYSNPDCEVLDVSAWQVANTAYVEGDFEGSCDECVTGTQYGKYGKMGYYACEDLTYPDQVDLWGELACQKIRRHRMPSHDITSLYDSGGCEDVSLVVYDENNVPQDVTATTWVEGDCVNLLGIRVSNVALPLDSDGNLIPDVYGFRILYAKRDGNKSILHKGLIYNMRQEINGEDDNQDILLFPNYPFNDGKPDFFLGTTETLNWDQTAHNDAVVWESGLVKNKYTYQSPDIHFKESKNEFGTELKLYTQEIGGIFGTISSVYKHPEQSIYKSDGVVSASYLNNYADQIDLVANYSRSLVQNNMLESVLSSFRIDYSQYLLPIRQYANQTKINNLFRESSYYMELSPSPSSLFDNPIWFGPAGIEDTSRVLASHYVPNTYWDDVTINYCSQINEFGNDYDVQSVSLYTGVKIRQPNQYGQIGSNTYIPLDACIITDDPSGQTFTVSGGDIFISRHSVVKKMPLFTEWLYDVPFDTLYNYRNFRNVWYPRFWFDNQTVDYSVLYNFDNRYVSGSFVQGRFYTSVNGAAYYWCESEFIGDYRETDIRFNSQFYPKQEVPELTRSDRFKFDELFLYDFSLLGDSIDESRLTSQVGQLNSLDPDYNIGDYIVAYSLKDDPQSSYDNWLKFLPLNYTVLPRIYGDFTGMSYIDQYSILFNFENITLHSQEDYSLTINQGGSLFLAQGDIFTRRLRKLSNEVTGYTGSVDPFFTINTRYGTYFYDRYRKTFFSWTDQLTPIIDLKPFLNNFNSITNAGYLNSMISVYDNLTGNIYITDKVRGWTISYKPNAQGFISFHSFVPDWYVPHWNTFLSLKDGGAWKHNAENYQNYFGVQCPFEVEFAVKNPMDVQLQSLELFVDYQTIDGYNSLTQNVDKFFTKGFVYNNKMSTGLLEFLVKDKNDLNQSLTQNKENPSIAEVSQVMENIYRINKLENNQVESPNFEFNSDGVSYNLLNINSNKNPLTKSKLTGRWFKVHLIDDENNTDKILVQLNLSQENENKR